MFNQNKFLLFLSLSKFRVHKFLQSKVGCFGENQEEMSWPKGSPMVTRHWNSEVLILVFAWRPRLLHNTGNPKKLQWLWKSTAGYADGGEVNIRLAFTEKQALMWCCLLRGSQSKMCGLCSFLEFKIYICRETCTGNCLPSDSLSNAYEVASGRLWAMHCNLM